MPLCKNFGNEISGPESQAVVAYRSWGKRRMRAGGAVRPDGWRPEVGRSSSAGEKLEIRSVKKWRLSGVSAEGGFEGKDWGFETERGGVFQKSCVFFSVVPSWDNLGVLYSGFGWCLELVSDSWFSDSQSDGQIELLGKAE